MSGDYISQNSPVGSARLGGDCHTIIKVRLRIASAQMLLSAYLPTPVRRVDWYRIDRRGQIGCADRSLRISPLAIGYQPATYCGR
jgi:hypothetical protein